MPFGSSPLSLHFSCQFDTRDKAEPTHAGYGSEDEMCQLYINVMRTRSLQAFPWERCTGLKIPGNSTQSSTQLFFVKALVYCKPSENFALTKLARFAQISVFPRSCQAGR